MIEQIGDIAGIVWETLKEKDEINISELPKIIKKAKPEMIYMALEWLAREGKIDYSTKNKRMFVLLSESEKSK